LLTRQQKWDEKARKAGYKRRSYMVHNWLNTMMEDYIMKRSVEEPDLSKSRLIQVALVEYFRSRNVEAPSGIVQPDESKALT
jgi:hypothetical protein